MKLIINADDLGYSPGINRGILCGFRRGVLTSTTLMINQPYTEEAVQMLKDNPILRAGLHINLTRGVPLSDPSAIKSLTDEKGLFKKAECYFTEPIKSAEVEKEILTQLKFFYETGLEASHLDAHQHLQIHPVILKAMIKGAKLYNLPIRSVNPETRLILNREKIPTPDYFISNFFAEGATLKNLKKVLSHLVGVFPDGIVELMTHPGCEDGNPQNSSYYFQRTLELLHLCSPEMEQLLYELHIELTDYRTLTYPFPNI